jgi:hypothetical protein
MDGLRKHLADDQVVYVYALVATDDFSNVAGYANTTKHFRESDGRALDQWYFAQWSATGMDIDATVLEELLGDPTDDDPEIQAAWLHALTEGLKMARAQDGLKFRGNGVVTFCSMIDSKNAVWVEQRTARLTNPPDLLKACEAGLKAAAEEWYGTTPPHPTELQTAFAKLYK